jgi:hypothetical protein
MICKRCGSTLDADAPILKKIRGFCVACIIGAVESMPYPECEYCHGEGEYYRHSQDCDSDLCALAGGYEDCAGEIVKCDCCILDRWAEIWQFETGKK